MACYWWEADLYEQCGKLDPETGYGCQLPADAPEFYVGGEDDGTEVHEYRAVFTDS